jgi:hypothetical protein
MTADRYEFHDLVFCSCELFKNFDSLKNVQQRRLNPRDTSLAFSLWQPVQLSFYNPGSSPGIALARSSVIQQAYLPLHGAMKKTFGTLHDGFPSDKHHKAFPSAQPPADGILPNR